MENSTPMNIQQKISSSVCTLVSFLVLLTSAIIATPAKAQSTQTFYYWVVGSFRNLSSPHESFVIAVDAATANQIEAIRNKGGYSRPGFGGRIAAGSVDYNRDYYTPNHRVWNWHVTSIEGIFDFNETVFVQCVCPDLISNPSDIAANPDEWIRQNGDLYVPEYYEIVAQIDPNRKDALINVSNRGVTGGGERVLIGGFVLTGGQPRNVVVRALGPTLGQYGVKQVAGNPKLQVYQGSRRIASNADWKTDPRANELAQNYPSLAPTNDKEAALLLTLLPGAYTLWGINEDGTEGIVLLEAYDVDSGNQ